MKAKLHFYLDEQYAETVRAITWRSAWESACYHKAKNALRRECRRMMRIAALRAVELARKDAEKRAARELLFERFG